jgi:hypothetical protein
MRNIEVKIASWFSKLISQDAFAFDVQAFLRQPNDSDKGPKSITLERRKIHLWQTCVELCLGVLGSRTLS